MGPITRAVARQARWAIAVLVAVVAVAATRAVASSGQAAAASTGLTLITEPNAGMSLIYRLLEGAKHSVDLTMYELSDPTAEAALAADAARGVAVRVLLDQHYEQSANTPAFTYLEHHRVAVRWAPARYDLTHEKAAVIDGRTALVMTLNLTTEYYVTTRDFAVVDTESADVAAIETVFDHDWSNSAISAPDGSDLVWSPGAESALVGVIDSAHHSLLIENEEMDDPYITTPLENAARRGVSVDVVMTDSSEWKSAFAELSAAGVHVRTYAASASALHPREGHRRRRRLRGWRELRRLAELLDRVARLQPRARDHHHRPRHHQRHRLGGPRRLRRGEPVDVSESCVPARFGRADRDEIMRQATCFPTVVRAAFVSSGDVSSSGLARSERMACARSSASCCATRSSRAIGGSS